MYRQYANSEVLSGLARGLFGAMLEFASFYLSLGSALNSFVWYDYETFGIHPAFDRPAQFAAVRTDENLNEIEPPLELYCKQSDDYLPHPQAVLITGITPQECQRKGVSEYEFIKAIQQLFSVPNTCVLGYNSIRFDDEVTRYTLYRNFFDPYAREWQNGNSRWDLLDVVRATFALRPEGINWPVHENGRPSFKLEDLTRANGIAHGHAHDALSDVRATIALAKLIKEKQPKLFNYFFNLRKKDAVGALIDVANIKPLVHVSGMISAERGCMTVVAPLCWHPSNKNSAIVWDLQADPSELYALSAQEIQDRVFTKQEFLSPSLSRLPLKEVHINKAPILAPFSTLNEAQAARFHIQFDVLHQHLAIFQQRENLTAKLHQVFSGKEFAASSDVDGMLYAEFFPAQDKNRMEQIHQLSPEALAQWTASFTDGRGEEMLFRFRARNFPETLHEGEVERWHEHCKARLFHNDASKPWLSFTQFSHELQKAAQAHPSSPEKLALLEELQLYAESIYPYADY